MAAFTHRLLLLAPLVLLAVQAAAERDSQFIVEYKPEEYRLVRIQLEQQGYDIVREYEQFNRLVVSGGTIIATASTQLGEVSPELLDKEVSAQLSAMGGVGRVETGGKRYLFPQPVVSISPPSLPALPGSEGNVSDEEMCSESDGKLGPDSELGRSAEGTPYGIKMVQADQPAMIDISKNFNDKVMWCVIDTGLDKNNKDFPEGTSGCMPGFPNGDTSRPYRYCYTWFEDGNRHGTHTSGTIAAVRNGHGVVGVSAEGAQVYHYNYFGPNMDASDDLEVAAWQECIAELDRRKEATATPDMKMVISMSYGSTTATDFSKSALASLAATRRDVMWIAAAGNGGDNSTNYPAGYDEVISIGAVNWNGDVADFSTFNADVELAAPGVQTLSTIPLTMTNTSTYYALPFSRDILAIDPPLAVEALSNDTQFFNKPKVARVEGTPAGAVTAPLFDCGLAKETCEGAEGKVCLIQRGETTFCEKVFNCAAGGGIGVIIYNRDDLPECERLSGVSVDICLVAPERGWPVAITASAKQGKALKAALEAGATYNITLNVQEPNVQTDYALDMLSGTSMATPTAAGVAGLVWSAHTACSASDIRHALQQTAFRPGHAAAQLESYNLTATTTTDGLVRDEKYGYGIVQAAAAHEYLQQHPCNPAALELDMLTKSSGPAGRGVEAAVGSTVAVKVYVKEAHGEVKVPVVGQRVSLIVEPYRNALKCQQYSLTTNRRGYATTSCVVQTAGRGKVTARVVPAHGSAIAIINTFNAKARM